VENKEARPNCHDCRVLAPTTEADYTLSTMAWRCVVEVDLSGKKRAVWRCATCWAKRRATQDKTNPGLRLKPTNGAPR